MIKNFSNGHSVIFETSGVNRKASHLFALS